MKKENDIFCNLFDRVNIDISNYDVEIELLDIDKHISKLNKPIYLNSLIGPNFTERIIEACTSKKEDVDIIFSCECGNLEGNYLEGSRCSKCYTIVQEDGIKLNDVILEIPFNIHVFHPRVYGMLFNIRKIGTLFDSILDRSTELPVTLKSVGINQQGWTYVYNNFWFILKTIIDNFIPKEKLEEANNLYKYLDKNKHLIFTDKLVVSGSIHTIGKAGKHITVDHTLKPLTEAIFDILSFQQSSVFKIDSYEISLFRSYKTYIEYLLKIYESRLKTKHGIHRGNVFGNSMFFTLRAVIVPITDPHEGDEIHIGWEAALTILSYHVLNKLIKRGFTLHEANEYKNVHKTKYSKIIDECFQEIIEESPYKGIPILLNRNPSIMPGSIVLLFITKIKFGSKVIELSDLILPHMNGDFDGDALHLALITEGNEENVAKFMSQHPKYQIIRCKNLEAELYLPSNLFLTLNEWYKDDDLQEYVDPIIQGG